MTANGERMDPRSSMQPPTLIRSTKIAANVPRRSNTSGAPSASHRLPREDLRPPHPEEPRGHGGDADARSSEPRPTDDGAARMRAKNDDEAAGGDAMIASRPMETARSRSRTRSKSRSKSEDDARNPSRKRRHDEYEHDEGEIPREADSFRAKHSRYSSRSRSRSRSYTRSRSPTRSVTDDEEGEYHQDDKDEERRRQRRSGSRRHHRDRDRDRYRDGGKSRRKSSKKHSRREERRRSRTKSRSRSRSRDYSTRRDERDRRQHAHRGRDGNRGRERDWDDRDRDRERDDRSSRYQHHRDRYEEKRRPREEEDRDRRKRSRWDDPARDVPRGSRVRNDQGYVIRGRNDTSQGTKKRAAVDAMETRRYGVSKDREELWEAHQRERGTEYGRVASQTEPRPPPPPQQTYGEPRVGSVGPADGVRTVFTKEEMPRGPPAAAAAPPPPPLMHHRLSKSSLAVGMEDTVQEFAKSQAPYYAAYDARRGAAGSRYGSREGAPSSLLSTQRGGDARETRPPPSVEAPPSPDVTKHLEKIAHTYGASFHSLAGLDNPIGLIDGLKTTGSIFVSNARFEAAAIGKQQQEARHLRALLGMQGPGVDDTAIPFSGEEFSTLPPPTEAQQALLAAQQQVAQAATDAKGEAAAPINATELQHPSTVIEIPLSFPSATALPPDPRQRYAEEYGAMRQYVKRPLPAPQFAAPPPPEPLKRQHSWSYDPAKAAAAVTPLPRKDSSKQKDREGGGGRSSRASMPPSAPHHAPLSTSAAETTPAAAKAPTVMTAPKVLLDLDEGFFEATLPAGQKSETGQFSALCKRLVSTGIVPAGWPAYRTQDGLWVPLQEGLTLEDFCWPCREAVAEKGSTRDGHGIRSIHECPPHVTEAFETPELEERMLKDSLSGGVGARVATALHPPTLTDHSVAQMVSLKDASAQGRTDEGGAGGATLMEESPAEGVLRAWFKQRAETEASRAYRTLETHLKASEMTLSERAVSQHASAAPPHLVAAVHAAILEDHMAIQQVSKQVLTAVVRGMRSKNVSTKRKG